MYTFSTVGFGFFVVGYAYLLCHMAQDAIDELHGARYDRKIGSC